MVRGLTEMFGRRFLFCNRDFSYRLCRAFDCASFKRKIKMLSFSQAEMCATKSLLSILLRWDKALSCSFFILSMGRTIRTSQ